MKKKVYMIGNAHLDPVWLWRWQEGYGENRATFRSALERLDEYEETVFTSSSAQFFEWIEESEPEMFLKLKERIQEGRIVLCGGWWIQPDCNIPCGESFARQGLLGQNYFYEKFGITCKAGYCVDSFGHNGMLPQILRLSGMDAYVFMRPDEKEKEIGEYLFEWEAPDGSSVTAFRIPGSYCAYEGLEQQIEDCIRQGSEKGQPIMCFYGVGNHGGGPTKKNIELVQAKMEDNQEFGIVFSSPDEYFKDVEAGNLNMKKLKGDLQHHSSGCYSLNSTIKNLNRRAENELLKAEKYEMLAAGLLGTVKEQEALNRAWKKVLFNQFHDILAGTIVKSAFHDAVQMYGEARTLALESANRMMQKIASRIDIPFRENTVSVIVFNPLGWEIESGVELEIGAFKNNDISDRVRVTDGKGREYDCQFVPSDTFLKGRKKIVFMAKIPAMGYRQFWIESLEGKCLDEKCRGEAARKEYVLENEYLSIRFNPETGGIESFFDLKRKLELMRGEGAVGKVMEDKSDAWAHDIFEFHERYGQFQLESIRKTEEGIVRSTIQVKSKFHNSEMIQYFTLYGQKDMLEVKVSLNWQEKRKCLKLEFPVNVKDAKALYEIPFGFIEKECDGMEEPMQNYFSINGFAMDGSGRGAGMAVLNDGKYSGDIKGNIMSLTVLRSPAYAHHRPYVLESAENDMFVDQGWQEFSYVLTGTAGGREDEALARKALEINQRPEVLLESFHSGMLPAEAGFLSASPENIVITCCKRAYDGNGWIVRFYESEGKGTIARITVGGKETEHTLRPNEIKTIRLSQDFKVISEADLLEWPQE